MSTDLTISAPAGTIPASAFLIGDINGQANSVSSANPMPSANPQVTVPVSSALTLAAGAASSAVGLAQTSGYYLVTTLAGTSPSVTVQELSPLDQTWQSTSIVLTATAYTKTPFNVVAGAGGASIRLINSGSNSVTVSAVVVN